MKVRGLHSSIFLFFFICRFSFAQYELKIILLDENADVKKLSWQRTQKDSASVYKELNAFIRTLHAEAYLAAGFDSIVFDRISATAYLYSGPQFKWAKLSTGNVPGPVLEKNNYHARDYRDKVFSYRQVSKLENSIVRWSENNGYPFASIALDSLTITEDKLHASLDWQKGPLIYFDSIRLEGKVKVKARFISRHLRIYKNQLYSQERIDQMPVLLRELPYVVVMRPPLVSFRDNKATVQIFLKDRKVSSVDGIVGFLPNESNKKKLLVTGEFNLNLRNLFGTGKTLQVEWKKIKESTQTLDMNYAHPKLFGSPLDVKFNFNFFKQDSSFLTVNRKLVISNRIGTYSRFNIITGLKTSRQLGSVQYLDTARLRYTDYNHYTYGLGYDLNYTDDFYYPHKGWVVNVQGTLGNKIIQRNAEVDESVYQNLRMRSQQWNFEANVERYTKLGKKSVLLSRATGGKLFNNTSNLFFNDLYRIGGLKTLRGFNENTFFAATYGTATLEYRFYTEETSYLLVFVDQGVIENPINPVRKMDYPIGFGIGLSFTTPAGIFNFIYSLGNSADSPLNVNLSKIHFGITSRF